MGDWASSVNRGPVDLFSFDWFPDTLFNQFALKVKATIQWQLWKNVPISIPRRQRMEFIFPIDLSLEGPLLLLLVFFPHVSWNELLCSSGTMCLLAVEHQEINKALCTVIGRAYGKARSPARFDVLFFSFFSFQKKPLWYCSSLLWTLRSYFLSVMKVCTSEGNFC